MITYKMICNDKALAVSLHRELWNWIADNPGQNKRGWPRWDFNGGDVEFCKYLCFCCAYNDSKTERECIYCPVKWPTKSTRAYCNSIYNDDLGLLPRFMHYLFNGNYEKSSQLARAIANLPENNKLGVVPVKIVFYSDAGHGWGQIHVNDIPLCIGEKISSYSYIKGRCVYLEEDCDLPMFLDHLKWSNIPSTILKRATVKHSRIRSYEPYSYYSFCIAKNGIPV